MFLVAKSVNVISGTIFGRKGIVDMNIPVEFFSLKLVLFSIGEPITKSSVFAELLIKTDITDIKKEYTDNL